MKLYSEAEREWILARGGLVLETVDCRVCGATMVPHLLWPDADPSQAGLCDAHLEQAFSLLLADRSA